MSNVSTKESTNKTKAGVKTRKKYRKRSLVFDNYTSISDAEFKHQLSDTKDIVCLIDYSPPTKKMMLMKEMSGPEKLFGLPGLQILSKTLSNMFSRHLVTRMNPHEDDKLTKEEIEDLGLTPLKNGEDSLKFPKIFIF